jgi:hypothetical protein
MSMVASSLMSVLVKFEAGAVFRGTPRNRRMFVPAGLIRWTSTSRALAWLIVSCTSTSAMANASGKLSGTVMTELPIKGRPVLGSAKPMGCGTSVAV